MRTLGFALFLLIGCAPATVPSENPSVPVQRVPVEARTVPEPVAASVPVVVDPPVGEPKLEPCKGHSPADPVPFLKGQLHVHSERSFDAATPVDDVLSFYAKRGYDFVSITDHNHITIPKEHPSGMLTIPGVELTYNATACDPPPRPGYLCVFHTNVLFLNPMRDATRGRHFNLPFRRQRMEALQVQLDRAEDLDGLLVLNHPTYHYAVDAEFLDELIGRGVRFVEFFSAGVIDHDRAGSIAAIQQGEALWDAMLDRGHRVIAMGGDDAHHFADAATLRMQGKNPLVGDRVWVMVRAERTVDAIRQAFAEGDFYVSSGVQLAELELTELNVHLRIEPREGRSYLTRFVGRGGQVLARTEGTDACFPTAGADGYVRAVVESDDGTYAWTQAVMVGDDRAHQTESH